MYQIKGEIVTPFVEPGGGGVGGDNKSITKSSLAYLHILGGQKVHFYYKLPSSFTNP